MAKKKKSPPKPGEPKAPKGGFGKEMADMGDGKGMMKTGGKKPALPFGGGKKSAKKKKTKK